MTDYATWLAHRAADDDPRIMDDAEANMALRDYLLGKGCPRCGRRYCICGELSAT